MNLVLVRDLSDPTLTLGTLTVKQLVLQTLELPWLPLPGQPFGRPDLSCVPAGDYQLVVHDSPRHPYTWALVNSALGVYHEPNDVPAGQTGRVACLIHTANWVDQLEGCIAVGSGRIHEAEGGGNWYLTESQRAFIALKATVPWTNDHTLSIGVNA